MDCKDDDRVFSVLIVDDDPVLRCIHKALLSKKGLQTKTVNNGQEAVDLFKSGACFELVLTDMEMPIMDGIQATKKLRSMDAKTIIVGITACDSEGAVHEFTKSGLNFCLRKPLTHQKVDSIVALLKE